MTPNSEELPFRSGTGSGGVGKKSSLVHSADLCRGRVRVRVRVSKVRVRVKVRAVIDRYAI